MRTLQVAAAAVLAVAGTGSVSACSSGCDKTSIDVTPVHLTAPTAPVTLTARLTADGTPLPAVRLIFFITATGPNHYTGVAAGYGMTNDDGVATLTRRDGVAGVILPEATATGYSAEFRSVVKINGKHYCGARAQTGFA